MGQASSAGDLSGGNAAAVEQTEQVVNTQVEAPTGDVGAGDTAEAQSSSANQDATELTLDQVIASAIKPSEPVKSEAASSGGEGGAEIESQAKTDDPANAESQEEADAKLPFHKHPRWQEVLRERDSYKAGHEQFEQIQTFMQVNQLDAAEVANGFKIMALMRQDPEQALELLRPYVDSLELATGRKLPDDLADRVENGLIDEDTARETARLRADVQRGKQRSEVLEQNTVQQQQIAQAQAVQTAVRVVEAELQGSDPDYQRKAPFLMDRIRALILAENPRTPEQATAIVRRAHKDVSEQLKPMIQRRPVTTATSGDVAVTSRPEPKSLQDAIRQAAAQSR